MDPVFELVAGEVLVSSSNVWCIILTHPICSFLSRLVTLGRRMSSIVVDLIKDGRC